MKKKLFGIAIVLLMLITTPVYAKDINHFYTKASDNVTFEDKVIGDSAIAGNLVDIIGNIDGIGFIAGNTVSVNGEVEYGFVAGNKVSVNGSVKKNLYAAAHDITLSKDAKVTRDMFAAASAVIVEGNVERDAFIGASEVLIKGDAKIGGNVRISADKITVLDGAAIEGTLKYNKDAKATISEAAKIGKIDTYKLQEPETSKTSTITSALISTVNMIVVFVVLVTLIPRACDKSLKLYEDKSKYFKGFGAGLLLLICLPIICIFLLLSSIGISLAFVLLGIYLISLYLSYVFSGYLLGDVLVTKLLKKNINVYLVGIIGIVVLKLLLLIPVLGDFLNVIAVALGLATICKIMIQKENKPKKTDDKVVEAEVIKKKTKK